jgi:signal transduction histidine kinase
VERVIIDANGRSFRAAVTEDHQTVVVAAAEYATELTPAVLLLAIVLIAANFAQISIGLHPLEKLRFAVHEVIARRRIRLDVVAPTELRPLADEIDRLLDGQQKALRRARSRATDLAHGLKTPLQVLSSDIRALRAKGEEVLADEIENSSAAIRRHVERELARARLAPDNTPGAVSNVEEVAGDVIGVVRRTPSGSSLTFDVRIKNDVRASIDPGDLAEILGSLIENAVRFATSTICIEARDADDNLTVVVTDDGPGIPDADRDSVLRRGVKLKAATGTGLGLSIVSDIVEAYGGRVELADARPGLTVTLVFPKEAISRDRPSPSAPAPTPCRAT